MNELDFDELVHSLEEAVAIKQGKARPSRTFRREVPDIKRLRAELGLSQPQFAAMIGVSVATLRNWEQRRRRPRGPARALLLVAAKHPEAVLDALRLAAQAA